MENDNQLDYLNKRKYIDDQGIKFSKKNLELENHIKELMNSKEYKDFKNNNTTRYLATDIEELMELQQYKNFKSDSSKKYKRYDSNNTNKLIQIEHDNDFDKDFQDIEIRRLFGDIKDNVSIETLKKMCKKHGLEIPESYTIVQVFKAMFDFAINYNFDKNDTSYPTGYSIIKKYLNSIIIKYMRISNINKKDQKGLILENIKLNTINALINYNQLVKIIVVELNRNTIEKMEEIYYNRYEKYKDNVEFYSGTLLDDMITEKCNDLPNIIFTDFMGTYSGKNFHINVMIKIVIL
jgi:hypothetical protein